MAFIETIEIYCPFCDNKIKAIYQTYTRKYITDGCDNCKSTSGKINKFLSGTWTKIKTEKSFFKLIRK